MGPVIDAGGGRGVFKKAGKGFVLVVVIDGRLENRAVSLQVPVGAVRYQSGLIS